MTEAASTKARSGIRRKKPRRYPLFNSTGLMIYRVGTDQFALDVNPKRVFPPSETTLALAKTCLHFQAKRALDIGTGSGLLAIALAKAGCNDVMAIDKNRYAVACAKKNAALNGVGKQIRCKHANILTWRSHMKYDLIVSNPPFMPMPCESKFVSKEIAWAINGGEDGSAKMIAFAEAVALFLAPSGRYVFGLPHFAAHRKVLRKLGEVYHVRCLRTELIRFWLAEYGAAYRQHIWELVGNEIAEVVPQGQFIKTVLSVIECRLAKPSTRRYEAV